MKSYSLVLNGCANGSFEQTFFLSNSNRSSFHSVLPTNTEPNVYFKVEYEFVSVASTANIDVQDAYANNLPLSLHPIAILCNLCQFGHLQNENGTEAGAIAVAQPNIAHMTTIDGVEPSVVISVVHIAKATFTTNNVWSLDRIIVRSDSHVKLLRGMHKFTFTPL